MKLVIQQAIRDYNNLFSDEDRREYLVQKSFILARDKTGCQILQKQITEDVAWLSQQENPTPSQFVEDVLHQLLFQDTTFHKLMMHPLANFLC